MLGAELDRLGQISIHAPAKGATYPACVRSSMSSYFNPRSREGSDVPRQLGHSGHLDFNPRSREGSDDSAEGALRNQYLISIHAPAKGATLLLSSFFQLSPNFNPRSREGSDVIRIARWVVRPKISIHAPAKGATSHGLSSV